MEMSLKNGFCEMSQNEMEVIEGGSWDEVFEKVSPIGVLEFVYQLGQDFGAASVKFGRQCYDFFKDVKSIF